MHHFGTDKSGDGDEIGLAAAVTLFFGVVGGIVFLVFILSLVRAWIITIIWKWYVVPAFGLPQITMVTAFGISLLCAYLTKDYTSDSKLNKDKVIQGLLYPWLVLLSAWIGTWFM